MALIQNFQSLLFTGTPVVSSLTGISTHGSTHPSAAQFFLAGGGGTTGDICLACGRYQTGSPSLPSVFTPLLVSGADGNLWAGYRILGAGEAGSLQNMPAGATNWVTLQVVFRPDIPISLVTPTTQQLSGPTSGIPGPLVIPSTSSPSLAYAYFQSTGAISAGMSPTHDGQVFSTVSNIGMSFRGNNAAATAITCSQNDTGDSNLMFCGAISVF